MAKTKPREARPTNKITPQILVNRALRGETYITEDELCDVLAIFALTPEMGGCTIDWADRLVCIHALNLTLSFKEEK